jgi:hypothetical protein
MQRYLLALCFGLFSLAGSAQSKLFVKAGIGASIPVGIFEDAQTRQEAGLANTGTSLALTVGRDFHRHFGLSISGSMWNNPIDEARLAQQATEQYPFVEQINVSSGKWQFQTLYASPHGTVRVGDWLRLDVRLNAGVLWSKYPAFTGTGTGIDPRDGQAKPFVVLTPGLSATSFVYGGGGTAAVRISEQFHLFGDIDGLRAEPLFPASTITAGLGNDANGPNLGLSQPRSEFRQKVGTLSARLGVGLFF